jgi:Zn-dependent oligopeptidase
MPPHYTKIPLQAVNTLSLITLLNQEQNREVLWRTCWGMHRELGKHIEKQMRTHWELKGNSANTLGTREK